MMKVVNIIETFNTSSGTVLIVEGEGFSVGDTICDVNDNEYIIQKIQMSTQPADKEKVALFV